MIRNLAILHAHNTYNNGSYMMLLNFLWYYVKHAPQDSDIIFWIEFDGEDNRQRLLNELDLTAFPDKNATIRELPARITSADHSPLPARLFHLYSKLFRHTGKFRKLGIDTVVLLGGDDISEYYKKWMIISDLYRIYRYSKYFQTILAGQTIGPFTGIRKKIAGRCLAKTLIFSRDPITTDYLVNSLGITGKSVVSSADLCFPDLPGQELDSGPSGRYSLTPDSYLCLVPGGFISLYTRNREQYIAAWTSLVKELLQNQNYKQFRLVLLPHVTRPEDDREMIKEIVAGMGKDGSSERLVAVMEELTPGELRQILGSGYCTISSRMHAALSTFQMRKPAIALGYSVKYAGVIGSSVQCPELVIDCTAEKISRSDIFVKEVMDKLQWTTSTYDELILRLKSRIPLLQESAEDQIRTIARMGDKRKEDAIHV